MHYNMLIHQFVMLIAITNPFQIPPVFLSLTANMSREDRKAIAKTSSIAIAIALITVVWIGSQILSLFGISISAFEIAGGFVVCTIGYQLLTAQTPDVSAQTSEDIPKKNQIYNISIIPLAIPILAGPGTMIQIILITKDLHTITEKLILCGICLAVTFVLFATLYLSEHIKKILGENGLKVLSKLMGLILMSIAIKLIIDGLVQAFPGLLK